MQIIRSNYNHSGEKKKDRILSGQGKFFFAILLLVPANAFAQSPDRITLLGNFDDLEKGEYLFIYGKLATVQPESFLILEIVNPRGDLCQIQQLTPLSNGLFLTDSIPLMHPAFAARAHHSGSVGIGTEYYKVMFDNIIVELRE